jgi:DNA-binding transcriptional regulator LsrR (DeoR family)
MWFGHRKVVYLSEGAVSHAMVAYRMVTHASARCVVITAMSFVDPKATITLLYCTFANTLTHIVQLQSGLFTISQATPPQS